MPSSIINKKGVHQEQGDGKHDLGNLNALKNSSEEETALDSGWGWVIVGAVVVNNIINFGHFRCFGLYVLHFMRMFDADASQVAWIISIQIGLTNLFGPFGSTLIHLLGPRKVALAGGCITCLSFAFASIAPNLILVYFSYGVGGAMGLTCTFAPSIHMIGIYFRKHRGIANGLCMAGNSIGGIVIPPLMEWMLEEYGCRGTVLIMSSILFNSCACAMFWHPISWHSRPVRKALLEVRSLAYHKSSSGVDPKSHGMPSLVRFARRFSVATMTMTTDGCQVPAVCPAGLVTVQGVASSAEWTSPPEDKDVPGKKTPTPKQKVLDFRLLCQPMFWMLVVSNTCCMVAYPVLMFLLPLRFRELGYTQRDVASVLSILAFSDLVGRVVISGITDFIPLPRSVWYTTGYLMASGCAFALPYCPDYTSIAVAIGGFGIFSGTFIAVTLSRVSDIFGGNRVAMVWGLLSLCGGSCGLAGPPLLGYLMDVTNSYMICQTVTAAIFLVGALACFAEPVLKSSQKMADRATN